MTSPRDQFGGAAPSGSGMQYEIIRLKENVPSVPLRVLPAMHSLRSTNQWSYFHAIHFGYKGVDRKDKTKQRMRPFECIEKKNNKTKMIEVNCDQCNQYKARTKLKQDDEAHWTQEAKKAGILEERAVKAFVEPHLKAHNEWLKQFNKDSKHYINCLTVDGKLAMLQIPWKMKQALDKEIEELRTKGLEPISNFDTGVYFVFCRTGNFNQSTFSCKVYMEGDVLAPRVKLAPVPDDLLTKALEFLPDLKEGVTRKLTGEQITLLTQCSGDPSEVDTIMGMTQLPDGLDDDGGGEAPPPPPSNLAPKLPAPRSAATPSPLPAPAPVAAASVPPPPPAPKVETETEMRARLEAEMRVKMELEIKAQMAKLSQPVTTPVTQPTATASVQTLPLTPVATPSLGFDPMDPNVSPEDFARSFPPLPAR